MGSRSRKISMVPIQHNNSKTIISMDPIQHDNLIENRTLVGTWLENYDSENQLNDNSYSFETSHTSINDMQSTIDDRKNNLSITENHGNDGDGEIVLTDTVNVNLTLQSTAAKNIPSQNISLNNEIPSDNNEDVYVSDGSEYEPPKKKQPYKKVYPSAHNSSNSDSSSSSSSSSSSESTSSGSSSSKSNSDVLIVRHHNVFPETIEPSTLNVVRETIEPSTHNVVPDTIKPSTHNIVFETKEPSTILKSKKRTRNISQWKKNQRKDLKNSGQAYISSRGKAVAEKKIRLPCTNTCRLSCSNIFSTDERITIFETYWALGSYQRQRDFLASCIRQVEPEFRVIKIPKGGDVSRKCRKPNTSYFFVNKGKEVRVCKKFLINTLAISEKPLRTAIGDKFGSVSAVQADKRGKHGKQSKLDTETIESVRDHINSIPRIESHYIRANSTREYIDGGLTVAELHRNYSENRIVNNKQPANYDAYHRIFTTQFNISFFIPRKDQCDVCEAYKNAVDKEPLSSSYKLHQEEKSLSRIEKKQDLDECKKPDSNITVAIFDLQAVLPCPIGQSSAFFYKSKLNCYNFTVSNIKEEKTFCFFWHEGLGKRGANEIGTCVYNFLKDCSSSKPNSDIILFSDNCCGQQKNKFFLNMYYYAVSTLPISSITHKFLIRGHTQNEGDAIHSVIEKNIRRAKKSGPIYTPDQYVTLIQNDKKTGNRYIVNEMNFDNFYDLKLLSSDINLNTIKNIDGEIIKISEIKAVKFVKGSDTYKYKITYKTQEWNEAKIKISRTVKKNIKDISFSAVYKSKLPIANNKKQDIRQLISDNIVPTFYANFYNSLFD